MIVYKVLNLDNRSPIKNFKWPIPDGDKPTEWLVLEEDSRPFLCYKGYHGWLTLDIAKRNNTQNGKIYEMELEGDIVKDDEKAAGRFARLLKQVWPLPDEVWLKRINGALTGKDKIVVLKELERSLSRSYHNGSYNPVPVGYHKFLEWRGSDPEQNIGRCSQCGISELWHENWEDRERIRKQFPFHLSWEAVELLRYAEMGVPMI